MTMLIPTPLPSRRAFAEDGPTDAHHCSPFLNRYPIVIAHAHRQLRQAGHEQAFARLVAQLPETAKHGPGLGNVDEKGCHRHKTADFEMREREEFWYCLPKTGLGESTLGLLPGDVNLQKYR